MNDEKTQAEAALRAATDHLHSIKSEMLQAITAVQKKIEARYQPLLIDAAKVEHARKDELNEIRVAMAASNPLIGRRVHQPARARTWRGAGNAELFGMIEAYKPGDPISGTYAPEAGRLIIRILKNDGTPSTRHKQLGSNNDDLPFGWHFVETAAAEPKES